MSADANATPLSLANLALRTKSCRSLLTAWLAWRGDRLIPRHADLDPASIKSILPMVGLIEVKSTHEAIFRLAGSGLRDVFGFDPTGGNAVDLAPPDQRRRRAYRLFVPATVPCGYLGESQFNYSDGVSDWFESIGLPLEAPDPKSRNLIVFTLESLRGNRWQKRTGGLIDNPENVLRFFDIGAGAPPPADPPADFPAG